MEPLIDLGSLATWMTAEGLGDGPIVDVDQLTGGTQNILLRFSRDGRSYVLRRPPANPRPETNKAMLREARLLGAIADTAVPHARLWGVCADESVLGAAFYLMEPVDGFNPANGLPPLHAGSPEIQHAMGLSLVDGIAALGALDYLALGLDGFGKPDDYLARQVSRWQSQLDGYAQFDGWGGRAALPDVAAIGAWLDTHRPARFTPGIMHGDYHMANVMFRNDGADLAAIVDWELATIGDPLIDLGWLLATWHDGDEEGVVAVRPWIGFPTPEELVARYAERSAHDLSAIGWYKVFACYKLAILLEGTHARACAGKVAREMGDKMHGRAIHLFERAARWMR